jgi:hypothetical protein
MGPISNNSSQRARAMNGDEGPSRRSEHPFSGSGQRLGGYSTYTTYDSSRPEGEQTQQSYYEPYGDYAGSQGGYEDGDVDDRHGGSDDIFSSRSGGTQRPRGSMFAAGVAEMRRRRGRGQNPFSARGSGGSSEYMVERYQPRSSRALYEDPRMGMGGVVREPTQRSTHGMSMEDGGDDGFAEGSSPGYGRGEPSGYRRGQVYGEPRGFVQEQGHGRGSNGAGRLSGGRGRPQRYFNFAHLRP